MFVCEIVVDFDFIIEKDCPLNKGMYNYSKLETGKSLATHNDVKMWHYFVNDIYFAEYGEKELTPYTVTINVKEKENGDFVSHPLIFVLE